MELIRVNNVQKTYKTGTVALYDFVLRRVNLFLLLELVVVVSLHLLRCYIERKNLIRVLL